MNKIKLYFEDTISELLNKVSWPSWKELQGSAMVVMVASVIIALIVFAMDKTFAEILGMFYNSF